MLGPDKTYSSPILLEAPRGPMQSRPGDCDRQCNWTIKEGPRKGNRGPLGAVRGTDGPARGTKGPVTGTGPHFNCTKPHFNCTKPPKGLLTVVSKLWFEFSLEIEFPNHLLTSI